MRIPERWSLLALARFWLAFVVAVNHLRAFTDIGWLRVIPIFGAFEAILGFLLISGYSIAESFRHKSVGFYWRRTKRIYPVYIASIGFALWAYSPLWNWQFGLLLAANVFFLNQLVTTYSLVGPAWSLSLEAWLYALTPLIAKLREKTLAVMVIISLVFYAAYTCGRSLFDWPYYSNAGYGINLPALAFMWIMGFWLSASRNKPFVLKLVAFVFFYHIALNALIQGAYRFKHDALGLYIGDLSAYFWRALNLAIVWLIFRHIMREERSGPRFRWMSFCGDISYPLYLLHMSVYVILIRYQITNPVLMLLIAIAASAAVYLAFDAYSRRRHLSSKPSLV